MAFDAPVEVVASAARTADGNSGSLKLASMARNLNLLADVTAGSGIGRTLDLTVEWSHDGGTTWAQGQAADSFTQLTASTTTPDVKVKQFTVKAPHFRVVWVIAGTTPSWTFSVREYLT